ncbi:MAG: hypothetical protein ACREOO_06385 [bacterium]
MRRQGYLGLSLVLMLATFASSFAVKGQERQSTRQNQASPSSPEFSMRALRAEPGKPSLYEVRFMTADTLQAQADLVFEFPAALDLSLLEVASSTTIDGGFKITRERNVVHVHRTGLGAIIPPGRPVELKLGLITSPATLPGNLTVGFTQMGAPGKAAASKQSYPIQFVPKTNQ